MNNLINLLPPSLKTLVEKRQFSDAESQLNRELATVKQQHDNAYTRNKHLSELHFQYAVVAHENAQRTEALTHAKQSFSHDVFSFHQHPALVAIVLAEGSDDAQDFACEVSWWFSLAYEQVGDNDPLAFWTESDQQQVNINDLYPNPKTLNDTLAQYRHLPSVEQYILSNELFFKRLEKGSDVDGVLKLCDDYAQKGTNTAWCNAQKTVALFNAERYDDVVALWQGQDTNTINDAWAYMRLMVSRIYTGKGLPDTLIAVNPHDANDYYNLMTIVGDYYRQASLAFERLDDDADSTEKARLQREKAELERLSLFIGEHGLKLYRGVEQGELINGYANDAHFYAMYCRNFSNILDKVGDVSRALDVTEKGFSLSPFIENGRAMVNYACNLEQYDRAQTNIDTVRRELGGYLDFDEVFFLDSRELHAKASKGVDVYFSAEKAFKEKYADFLHNMRVNALITPTMRPQAVVDWTPTHNTFVGNVESAVALLFEKAPNNPDVIAYYFETQALTSNRPQVEWSKTFAPNISYVKADKSHPNYKVNLFKAQAGLGYLKLRQGGYEDSEAIYKEGIALLEDAIQQGEADPRSLADAHVKAGRYLQINLEDNERADKHLSKAIELLEAHGTKADNMGFIGDPLLSYAYFYRGKARDKLPKKSRPVDTVISDDFVKFCALNDGEDSYTGAYEVAYLSSEDKSRVDEQYQHAMQYIDTIEEMQADFSTRGNVMSLTVFNLLAHGDKERAEPLLEALKKDFPKHEDLKRIEKMLKKSSKRKKFLGLF